MDARPFVLVSSAGPPLLPQVAKKPFLRMANGGRWVAGQMASTWTRRGLGATRSRTLRIRREAHPGEPAEIL
jgi:hypothetical protein